MLKKAKNQQKMKQCCTHVYNYVAKKISDYISQMRNTLEIQRIEQFSDNYEFC